MFSGNKSLSDPFRNYRTHLFYIAIALAEYEVSSSICEKKGRRKAYLRFN